MRKAIIGIVLLFAVSACALAQESSQPAPQPSQPAAQEECTAKVPTFFAASGYKISPTTHCGVYFIDDALAEIPQSGLQGKVLIAEDAASDMLLIGTVVQPKADVDLSQGSLLKFVQLNNEIDYAKLGIDGDGDLFVRSETSLRATDEAAFKDAVDRVVKAAKKVYASVKK
jgi:hypothetical protein